MLASGNLFKLKTRTCETTTRKEQNACNYEVKQTIEFFC